MKMEILSYINEQGVPERLLQAPGEIDDEVLKNVLEAMVQSETQEFFTASFKNYKSANLFVKIFNPELNKNIITLLSIVITEGIIDFKTSEGLLNGFKEELLKIEAVYKGFYVKSKKYPESAKKFAEIQKLFFNFSKSYPEENVIFREKQDISIFIYGLDQAGKTALINGVKRNVTLKTIPTTNVNISRIKVKDISVRIYDAPGQLKFRGLWEPYLKMQQNGLVFVLDIVHRMRYPIAKNLLHEIANYPNLKKLPFLILFNKIDLVKPDMNQLCNEMDVNSVKDRPIKCFLTSAIHNVGIDESFEWLTQEISNIISKQK